MGVTGALAAPLTIQEEQFAIPKERLVPPPGPESTRLFLPQAQQGQLHCSCRNTVFFLRHSVDTTQIPSAATKWMLGPEKTLYQCCSVALTQSEMELFKERISLCKRQTRKGIMSFMYFFVERFV